MGWSCITGTAFIIYIIYWGVKYDPQDHKRKRLGLKVMTILARGHSLASGCVWSSNPRVKVDYSKYLGKDYVYRYDRVGIHV